jgi:hypothetical protein
MAELLYHAGAAATCFHGASVTVHSSNGRVFVGGSAVATLADQYTVEGCSFTLPNGKLQPCVRVEWQTATLRTRVNGEAAINRTSIGWCYSADNILNGVANVRSTQTQVAAT